MDETCELGNMWAPDQLQPTSSHELAREQPKIVPTTNPVQDKELRSASFRTWRL
ncbi:uncharacterized protein TrAFT101_011941 [Trichoderma asperellum]|uniref:uncharacterized protein n=1 Tax=Trichoderma asperellum TaxID=101201 RepID=UPI00331C4624|nr:hypothetical protein TrAFT101_011941 [Trichoderma asperellum]